MRALFSVFFVFSFLSGCGSAGGDGGQKVLEGQLIEGGGESHVKHSAGEALEGVQICAFNRCSKTDSRGMFGFSLPDEFRGGELLISAIGHNTEAQIIVNFSSEITTLFLHLQRVNSSRLTIHHQLWDNVRVESEDHAE